MNKIINTILFVLIFGFQTMSQDSKFLIGGTVGYGYSNIKSTNTSVSFETTEAKTLCGSPFFGYFVSKKMMIGLAIEFNFENSENDLDTNSDEEYSDILLSPNIRYYLNSSIFIQGQINYGISNRKYGTTINMGTEGPVYILQDSKSTVFGLGTGIGYDIKLSDNLKLEPMIRYVLNNYKNEDSTLDYKSTSILFKMGLIYLF